jgi:hypothetical protein
MEFMAFSLNMAPGGTPTRPSGTRWQPVSGEKKRKTPSQLQSNQLRKQECIAKKKASLDNTDAENSVEKGMKSVEGIICWYSKRCRRCNNCKHEYEKKVRKYIPKICEVEIYHEDTQNIANFRNKVVEFVEKKNNENVIKCEIENSFQILRLVTLVNLRSG